MKQKGTPLHDATVIGDTVGDPFKDTSSVALNPVIKFTTLFGLLAVELAVRLNRADRGTLTHVVVRGLLCRIVRVRCTGLSTACAFVRHNARGRLRMSGERGIPNLSGRPVLFLKHSLKMTENRICLPYRLTSNAAFANNYPHHPSSGRNHECEAIPAAGVFLKNGAALAGLAVGTIQPASGQSAGPEKTEAPPRDIHTYGERSRFENSVRTGAMGLYDPARPETTATSVSGPPRRIRSGSSHQPRCIS